MNKLRTQRTTKKNAEPKEPIGYSFEQQVATEIEFLGSFMKLEGDRQGIELREKAARMVQPDDFIGPEHGKIFAMIQDMLDRGEPILVATLRSQMIHAGFYEKFGGGPAMAALLTCGTSWPIKPAEDIRYFSVRRKLHDTIQSGMNLLQDSRQDNNWILFGLEREVELFRSKAGIKFRSAADIAKDIRAELDRPTRPLITTGLGKFDREIGGFAPGELIILAARTSIGKSALAAQIAEHTADKGQNVLFVTLEMRADDIVRRIISRESVVSVKQIRSGNMTTAQRQDVETATANCNQKHLFPFYMPSATITDIATTAKAFKAEHGIGLLVVDYVQIIKRSDFRMSLREAVGLSTSTLKRLAGELDCPVLCLSQFNRETTKQEAPTLANLAESGSIEADADMVVAIHRKSTQDIDGELLILKNRNGETMDLTGLRWCGGAMQYSFPNDGGQEWQP